jgi:hypothetical protein
VAWVVQRYITLAGAGTLYDPDPAVTQPGAVALDGAGQPLPTVTRTGSVAWGDVIVVDDAGIPQPPGAETFTLAFVKRTVSDFTAAAGGPPRPRSAWNRGVVSAGQSPGIEQTQTELEPPSAVVFVVLAGDSAPASGRLAVRVWEGDR